MNRCLLSVVAVFLLNAALVGAEPGWQAGTARAVITPAKPMWMSGYAGRDKPAAGKRHDLWAKCLVLQDAKGQRAALITLDLVGIPRDFSDRVRDRLRDQHKLGRADVILACSHTHTGPVVRNNLFTMYQLDDEQQQLVRDYTADLENKVVALVGTALGQLGPATLKWGNGQAAFAVNRRANKEADVPRLREAGELKGPVDHDVPVLAVCDDKGKLKAVVFGYACHATVLSDYQWSGDYAGYAQLELEKKHPEAVALFWAGCGADQNPLPRRKVELAEDYGSQLAAAVERVLAADKETLRPVAGRMRTAYSEIALPFADLPTREKLVEDSMSKDRYVAARAKYLLEELNAKKSLRGDYPYPVQVWRLGEVTWVALGGEVVVDYSLRLKKELPGATWVMGYANDVMAYIPSLRVLREGGYEGGGSMVYYGLPAVWGPRVEEQIVAAVHEQVKKVKD